MLVKVSIEVILREKQRRAGERRVAFKQQAARAVNSLLVWWLRDGSITLTTATSSRSVAAQRSGQAREDTYLEMRIAIAVVVALRAARGIQKKGWSFLRVGGGEKRKRGKEAAARELEEAQGSRANSCYAHRSANGLKTLIFVDMGWFANCAPAGRQVSRPREATIGWRVPVIHCESTAVPWAALPREGVCRERVSEDEDEDEDVTNDRRKPRQRRTDCFPSAPRPIPPKQPIVRLCLGLWQRLEDVLLAISPIQPH